MLYYTHVYRPDAALLWLSTARILMLDEEAEFLVINDKSNPVPTDLLPDSDRYSFIDSPYPLGGNLNGQAFIEGMTSTMLHFMEARGVKYICKFDVDCWVNSLDSFRVSDDNDFDYVGMSRADVATASGDFYRLSFEAVQAVQQGNQTYRYCKGSHVPEDRMVMFFCMSARLHCRLIEYSHGLHVGCHTFPGERQKKAHIVHCGETLSDGSRAPRELVLLRMQCMQHITCL